MAFDRPWHVPGKWHANPTYWEPEVAALRPDRRNTVLFIDSTLVEGEDAVGCHLSWASRLKLTEMLVELGVGEITIPRTTHRERADYVHWYRAQGFKTPIAAKGTGGTRVPLVSGWRDEINKLIELGADAIHPVFNWSVRETFNDFSVETTKEQAVEAIASMTDFATAQGVKFVPWLADTMRLRPDTACLFAKTVVDSGGAGVYLVDSRGNSHPAAVREYVRRIRQTIGDKLLYIQFHNDLGMATANAVMAAEAGADWLDCTMIGIGDRGGTAALEEVACSLAIYGTQTGIALDKLYEVCKYCEDAFAVQLHIWKPIAGSGWNKETGWGHRDPGDAPETPIGIAGEVLGRPFESVIGPNVFYGRYPRMIRDLVDEWGYQYEEGDIDEIVERAKSAVIARRGSISLDELRSISEGVLGGMPEAVAGRNET